MAERELEFTTRLTREDVAGLVEALIEGLKDGHLRVQKSNEVLELEVPRVVDLEVEAKVSDERAKFEIEVSWRTNRAENPDLPTETGKKDSAAPTGKQPGKSARKSAADAADADAAAPASSAKKKKTATAKTGATAKAGATATTGKSKSAAGKTKAAKTKSSTSGGKKSTDK
ncbi:amphi-Trp domain-containing protein [Desulfovibrio sp. OttesenSCG-928-A18]|nr:amphi-Trp domain-containing protein [Desulfovibrio sp. OttesenSCG-928-A18]